MQVSLLESVGFISITIHIKLMILESVVSQSPCPSMIDLSTHQCWSSKIPMPQTRIRTTSIDPRLRDSLSQSNKLAMNSVESLIGSKHSIILARLDTRSFRSLIVDVVI